MPGSHTSLGPPSPGLGINYKYAPMTIPNKGWETGDAGGWAFSGSFMIPEVVAPPAGYSGIPRLPATARTGRYVLDLRTYVGGAASALARYEIADERSLKKARGRRVTWNVNVWREVLFSGAGGFSSIIWLKDNVGNSGANIETGQIGRWNNFSVTRLINAAATYVRFDIVYTKAGGGDIYSITIDDMGVEGFL